MKNYELSELSFHMVIILIFAHFFQFLPRSAWLLFPFLVISFNSSPFISVCKGTNNINAIREKAIFLPLFNIRLHGFLTLRHPSMRHIAMVDEYAPESI